jgi:hypothetical protein
MLYGLDIETVVKYPPTHKHTHARTQIVVRAWSIMTGIMRSLRISVTNTPTAKPDSLMPQSPRVDTTLSPPHQPSVLTAHNLLLKPSLDPIILWHICSMQELWSQRNSRC